MPRHNSSLTRTWPRMIREAAYRSSAVGWRAAYRDRQAAAPRGGGGGGGRRRGPRGGRPAPPPGAGGGEVAGDVPRGGTARPVWRPRRVPVGRRRRRQPRRCCRGRAELVLQELPGVQAV